MHVFQSLAGEVYRHGLFSEVKVSSQQRHNVSIIMIESLATVTLSLFFQKLRMYPSKEDLQNKQSPRKRYLHIKIKQIIELDQGER